MRPEIAKTAVVTGAGSGFGRSICLELGKLGWRVGTVDLDMESAIQTALLVDGAGGSGEAYTCDVRDASQVAEMADHFFCSFGSVGLLFNNAGVGSGSDVGDFSLEEWHRIVDTNLWGVIHGCHEFVPRMKARGSGHIINTGSIGAFVVLPGTSAYSAAKAGVIALSETMRSELAPFGVGVTVVCPATFRSNILEGAQFGKPYQREVLELAFETARYTCDDLACHTLKAIEKNKLYALPQPSAWFSWIVKRVMPALMVRQWSWLNRHGLMERFLRLSVRSGW